MSNTITVHGNLGRDAELKYTSGGAPVLELSIADTPRRKNDRGEWEDAGDTNWFRASVWGPLAEALADIARKGAQATVTGTLAPRAFEKDGQARTSLDIRVDAIGIREKRGQSAPRPAPAPAQTAAQDPWATDGRTSEEPPW